ncbi:YraN family protein [bacterium]|nr:YraN family protein [bacterium]
MSFLSRFFGRRGHLTDDRARGRKGEELALHELAKKGYRVLEKNWRCRMGEIDLICMDNGTLVIVEVKSAGRASDFRPQDRVNLRKRNKLNALARAYLRSKPELRVPFRFDIVTVVWDGESPKIEHFRNAFS